MSRREVEAVAENVELELGAARDKIDELMGNEGRMEEELAGRIEVLDKLRTTVREMEKDKRETAKRYREQSESFDSERQSWYDQEQHYKTRISNLSTTATRKARMSTTTAGLPNPLDTRSTNASSDSESESSSRPNARHSLSSTSVRSGTASPTPSSGPSANEVALQEQLATLTTAHSSLTTTLRALQTELSDLKRVYQDLQEENESYEVLLGERTLNGEVRGTDLFRKSFQWGEGGEGTPTAAGFGFTGGLEAVGEEAEELSTESESDEGEFREADEMDDVERVLLESQGTGTPNSGAVLSRKATTRRRRSSARHGRESSAHSSVGGGSGMDLAAELEMADLDEDEQAKVERKKAKRDKKAAQAAATGDRRGSVMTVGLGDDLRSEVRQLREANKALTLYVSKIVDRVCATEGFEKVLAVDFARATPKATSSPPSAPEPEPKKPRPSSGFFGLGGGAQAAPATPTPTPLTPAPPPKKDPVATPNPADPNTPSGRKGLSWEGVTSAFGGMLSRSNTISTSSPSTNPHMKPLRLGESVNARKLELDEDDDDIRARMRLHREMAQLGIDGADGGNQWGHRSSISKEGMVPRDLDAEMTEENAPLAAKLALHATKVKESDAKTELEAGRASGFTEPKRRRPGSMRSANSSSRNSVMGLGISDPATGGSEVVSSSSQATTPELGSLGPAFSPTTPGDRTPSPRLGAPIEQLEGASPTWQKMAGGFKRLSRGLSLSGAHALTSPAPAVPVVPAVETEPATPEKV